MDAKTLARAEEFWAERLGCPVAALQRPGLTLLAHPQEVVFVVATARGTVAAAPPNLHGRIEAVADLRALTDWESLRALVPAPARTVGTAWLGYTREPADSTRDTQPFDSPRDPALVKLRAAVTPDEWRHGNLDRSEPPIFGCVEQGSVTAACGYERLLDRVAHLGVVADAERRGRGAGRRAVAAALACALERGLLAQYQTLVVNIPARRIADALGFEHFATTLSARALGHHVSEPLPKPAHLAPQYGGQFADRAVAAAYRARPPYPDAVFNCLTGLLARGPGPVLELGCGSGDLTLGLARRVTRLDAVEPARAMLEIARARACAEHSNVTWFAQAAEAFEPGERYALVVAAESLHWMEWSVVLPRIARWLEPGAPLAVVERSFTGLPFEPEVGALIARHSTNRVFRRSDLVEELTSRRLFRELGRLRTAPVPFAQSLDDYVESFHSRNGFSRERMSAASADEFDRGVRTAVLAHAPDGVVRGELSARIVWGAPLEGGTS